MIPGVRLPQREPFGESSLWACRWLLSMPVEKPCLTRGDVIAVRSRSTSIAVNVGWTDAASFEMPVRPSSARHYSGIARRLRANAVCPANDLRRGLVAELPIAPSGSL